MMSTIEDRQNILKSFEGQKIDQSVHVARWATINNEDSNRNIFNKYANSSGLNQPSSQSNIPNDNMYNTQESQVHEIDTGFKKLKTNQLQMLKQLKQEYQVLRNLNMEEKVSKPSRIVSSSESIQRPSSPSQILSNSSHRSKKKVTSQNINRQTQILALQKKQLQMVINNSMRKIQQLLHAEMQYKKQIHELKMQASGRQNNDIQYESMLKTLKKNEIHSHETIESLKKQNQKYKYQHRQLNQKISNIEGELLVKDQEIRRIFDEKRKLQDLIRLEKDRYFNMDIDYKKIKMEYELLEKDKNSQIARLNRQLEFKDSNKIRQLQGQIKRYEDDIELKDKRYSMLLGQLEELKQKYTRQEEEITQLRQAQGQHMLDKDRVEDILTDFRDHSDSVAFNKNINEVIQKLQEMDQHQNQYLREQIESLRAQLENMRQLSNQPSNLGNIQEYEDRIEQLQRDLRSQSYEKQTLIDENRRVKRDNQDLQRKINQFKNQIQQLQKVQAKLREQIRNIRRQRQNSPSRVQVYRDSTVKEVNTTIVNKQVETLQKQLNDTVINYKNKIQKLQDQLRMARRQADENQLKANRATSELEYKLKIKQNEHNGMLSRIGQDLERQRKEYNALKQEFQRYKEISEKKITSRDDQLDSLKAILRNTTDDSKSNVNNVRHEYQSLLKTERQRYKTQLQTLTTQVTTLTKSNQQYMQQTNRYLNNEKELAYIKEIMRRGIHLSQGVNHLWRVKQAEYQNVNEVLRQMTNWKY